MLCLGADGEQLHKKIEDVQIGDEVLAFNEETGKLAYRKVVQLFRNESKDWTGVSIRSEDVPEDGTADEIISTPGHKYYLPENTVCREVGEKHEHAGYEDLSVKWVSACNLKVGDKVLLASADPLTGKPKYGIVEKVRSIHYDKPQTTYNFEVERYHTYFVGENSVCVHNNGGDCKHPNGIYEDAKYHSETGNGWKGPKPVDGQQALDDSVVYKAKDGYSRRMAKENKRIVILDEHRPGRFHGHTRTYNELDKYMKPFVKARWGKLK